MFAGRTSRTIAYHTDMREGKIRSLRWDQIDPKAGLIRLKSLDTKTSEPRLVPLNHTLTALLKSATRYVNCPLVFPNPENLHRADPRYQAISTRCAFTWASQKAKVANAAFHNLRHPSVTDARRSGVGMISINATAGHKAMAVFKRYNIVDANDLQAAARQTGIATATGDLGCTEKGDVSRCK